MNSIAFLSLCFLASAATASIRGTRHLQSYYYSTVDPAILGHANEMAAVGNPMKGLITSPRWNKKPAESVPSSMDFYYIGLDEVMVGPNEFDWTVTDQMLSESGGQGKHVIWRFFCDWPGQTALRLPQYLYDAGLPIVQIDDSHYSPVYDDPLMLTAMEQFITALADKYDGHPGVYLLQAGLLGYWGEWHTFGTEGLVSTETKLNVAKWFSESFQTTMVQIRDPGITSEFPALGLHDDSFAYTTLDGEYNGGVYKNWYFWRKVEIAGRTDFWKNAVMGGETRPQLQETVFTDSYPAGTERNQDFNTCVDETHASYMIHAKAFVGDGFSGTTLSNTLRAHARMGYGFIVSKVAVASLNGDFLRVDVTVEQTGVAPFYFPLSLAFSCEGTSKLAVGVEQLVERGDSRAFSFSGIPAISSCLDSVQITLESDFTFPSRPVKFSQGNDGTVSLGLPLPPGQPSTGPLTESPVSTPVVQPTTQAPTEAPTRPSTSAPITESPTDSPVAGPASLPPSIAPATASPTASIRTEPPTISPTGFRTTAAPSIATPAVAPTTPPTTDTVDPLENTASPWSFLQWLINLIAALRL